MSSSNRLIWMFSWLLVDVEAYKSGCSGGYCFVISDYTNSSEFLDQFNAQKRCRSFGAQLVEIRNKDIQNSLVDLIRSVYYSQGLGGWNVLTNGKRSSGNWIRLSGNGVAGISFYDQTDVSYAYGYLKSTTSGFDQFASRPTGNKGGFICTGLSDCSGGVTMNGQCYKSFTETLSWYEARNRCLDGGGDLASFDQITSNAGFNALNGSWINTRNSYWIGIRREWWTWQSSNFEVKYSEWTTGHPIYYQANSDCLCLSPNEWKWIECGCNQPLPFVCISDNNSTTLSTTKTSTTTASTTTRTTHSATSTSTSTTAFESIGISTPIIQPLATSRSNQGATESENTDKSKGLTSTGVGVAVGLGIGLPLTIVIVALAVVIVRLKKQLRKALLSLKTNHTTSSRNPLQQPVGSDIHELNGVTGDPYESLQPRIERTPDGLYQSLDRSRKTDSSILSSNI